MDTIADNTLLVRSRELMSAPIDDDLVALDVESGLCYGFNETAAAVWRCLEAPVTPAGIAGRLSADFHIDEGRCLAEIMPLLGQMAGDGLIRSAAAA